MSDNLKMKDSFTVKVEGKEIKLAVKRPTAEQVKQGQQVFNRTLSEALNSKAPLRVKIEDVLKDQGIWDDDKKKKADELNKFIHEASLRLHKGRFKLSEAIDLAKEIIKKRRELRQLTAARDDAYSNSAESQADNARFNYFLSVCTVYDPENTPFFKDVEDVITRANDSNAITAASKFAMLYHNIDTNFAKKLPENKFLIKYGLMNDKLQFLKEINGTKVPVDDEGRRINDDGRFINDKGQFVDREGNLVNEEGDLVEEEGDFFDDLVNNTIEEVKQERNSSNSHPHPPIEIEVPAPSVSSGKKVKAG